MGSEKEIYQKRFEKHLDELKWLYMELYDAPEMFDELCSTMEKVDRKSVV